MCGSGQADGGYATGGPAAGGLAAGGFGAGGVAGGLTRLRLPLPAAAAGLPAAGRRRAKLWELTGSLHCSIIGTCLTTGELRRVLGKAGLGRAGQGRVGQAELSLLGDHELHTQAVTLSGQAGVAARLLHKALDERHAAAIRRLARVEGEAAVMARWDEARRDGDIPGTFWALLTHPDVGYAGLRQAFCDVHMLSHLVGAANRADIRRLAALEEENAALRDKVERQQQRLHEAVTSRDATIRQLGGLAAGRVAQAAAGGDDALSGLRHLVADLQDRLAREAGGRERLEQRARDAAASAEAWERRAAGAEAERGLLRRELDALERHAGEAAAGREAGAEAGAGGPAWALPAQRILYVGGRPGCVERMRACLAAAGGELLRHDGGQHDHPSLLAGLIGQADRVAFPVDCVSHDAALTVKRLCRQLGKRWLPLRSAGLASFLAALGEGDGA